MNNKTCGECKHFEVDAFAATCEKQRWICDDDTPACNKFKPKVITNGDKIRVSKKQTLFDRITASPEVLAPYFVFATEDTVLSRHDERDILYFSSITGGYYQYQDNALAATVAKLKGIEK